MTTALQKHLRAIADKEKELEELHAAAATIRIEEAKTLGDAFIHKLEQAGLTVQEGIDALNALHGVMKKAEMRPRATRGTAAPKEEPAYVRGAQYKDPKTAEVFPKKTGDDWRWTRRPEWLATMVPDSMTHEEKMAAYALLEVKG